MPDDKTYDCLVVGGGPAGLTTALYLRRLHRQVLLVDEGASRARWIDCTRNYPGFPDGISGEELLQRMKRQLEGAGGAVRSACVEALEPRPGGGFIAQLGDSQVSARTVMLATGVVDRVPALPGLDAVRAAGRLRQCPICDGHEHSRQRAAVLGSGAHAAGEALFLAELGCEATLVAIADDGDPPVLERDLAGRLRALDVRIAPRPAVAAGIGADGCVELRLDGGAWIEVDVVYTALGVEPRVRLAQALGAGLDAGGKLLVDARCRSTLAGLYAAGDVVDSLDQLAVATGQGAIAAAAIHRQLREAGLLPTPEAPPATRR
ncbi:pyridine nucleotide-disulfide oxidoreductase [Rubrivivax gelatinosus]|nr:pyridine nucleotide-disulfide oxidoreductase [Rubrivivax gelatinosus]